MKDRDFLKWLHARLVVVHGESEIVDYMHKLRAIIAATDPEKVTPNTLVFNSLGQLEASEKEA
jgi:hypothetical protein